MGLLSFIAIYNKRRGIFSDYRGHTENTVQEVLIPDIP